MADYFPSNRLEALTLLWLQQQDLSSISPEDLQALYFSTYKRLKADAASKRASGGFRDPNPEET